MFCHKLGMYTETSIQDLPDEMLEQILLFLNIYDRRSALRVCRRWSTLIPLSSVKLVVDFRRDHGQKTDYHRTLLASSRQYKHLVIHFGPDTDKNELLVEILQHFSHKMESLKIIPCILLIEEMLIAQLLSLCSNLRHLHIGYCIPEVGPHDLEISPMHKLEELYLKNNLLSLTPNMMNITPNIKRLHLQLLHSEEAPIFLRHYSSQLDELELWIHFKDRFLRVCEMQFPLLQKLNFHCDYSEINPGGSFDEVEMIDKFFRQIPLLQEVTLDCELDDGVIQNLCRSCVNIQFLCVKMHSILHDCFRAICELKHLQHLRIEHAVVDVPPEMYSPQTSLHKLTLKYTRIKHKADFNSFVQRVFPNLAVMELHDLVAVNDVDKDWLFELHGQICSNIPSLQCLVVSELCKEIILGRFLEFCATHATKDLRFEFFDIMDISENIIPNRIPMQKLVLNLSLISPIMVQKLITSMAELKGLELSLDDNWSLEEVSSLRKQLPRCHIAVLLSTPQLRHNFLSGFSELILLFYQGSRISNSSKLVDQLAFRRIMSEMSTKTSIQDLPDEMLEQILLCLSLDNRRSALQVCRRWSTLKPFDWSSVRLVVDFAQNIGEEANYHRTLLASSRQYKHLVLCFGKNSSKYELLVKILQHFSHKVETLKIIPYGYVLSEQMLITQITVIAEITAFCFNLRYLYIGECIFNCGPQDLEFSPMYKLEELYLEDKLLSLLPNLMDFTPIITRLHMINYGNYINSRKVEMFLRHFSSQLVELEIWVLPQDDFLMDREMHFPLLEKLSLREITIQYDDRVLRNLCRSCVNIQFLCVRHCCLTPEGFRVICELKNLKRLIIKEATVKAPTDMYSPQTSLQKLTPHRTLIILQVEFNSFVQRAFPNLTDVELLDLAHVNRIDERLSFELYGQICSNIPSLQRLIVRELGAKIKLDQFLEFCASHSPKELRFRCSEIFDISENKTPYRIPVQKLFLDLQRISPIVLQKLISSMEELRWQEIVLTDNLSSEEISSLREQFPRCNVVAKRLVVIKEPFDRAGKSVELLHWRNEFFRFDPSGVQH